MSEDTDDLWQRYLGGEGIAAGLSDLIAESAALRARVANAEMNAEVHGRARGLAEAEVESLRARVEELEDQLAEGAVAFGSLTATQEQLRAVMLERNARVDALTARLEAAERERADLRVENDKIRRSEEQLIAENTAILVVGGKAEKNLAAAEALLRRVDEIGIDYASHFLLEPFASLLRDTRAFLAREGSHE